MSTLPSPRSKRREERPQAFVLFLFSSKSLPKGPLPWQVLSVISFLSSQYAPCFHGLPWSEVMHTDSHSPHSQYSRSYFLFTLQLMLVGCMLVDCTTNYACNFCTARLRTALLLLSYSSNLLCFPALMHRCTMTDLTDPDFFNNDVYEIEERISLYVLPWLTYGVIGSTFASILGRFHRGLHQGLHRQEATNNNKVLGAYPGVFPATAVWQWPSDGMRMNTFFCLCECQTCPDCTYIMYHMPCVHVYHSHL